MTLVVELQLSIIGGPFCPAPTLMPWARAQVTDCSIPTTGKLILELSSILPLAMNVILGAVALVSLQKSCSLYEAAAGLCSAHTSHVT